MTLRSSPMLLPTYRSVCAAAGIASRHRASATFRNIPSLPIFPSLSGSGGMRLLPAGLGLFLVVAGTFGEGNHIALAVLLQAGRGIGQRRHPCLVILVAVLIVHLNIPSVASATHPGDGATGRCRPQWRGPQG